MRGEGTREQRRMRGQGRRGDRWRGGRRVGGGERRVGGGERREEGGRSVGEQILEGLRGVEEGRERGGSRGEGRARREGAHL